MGSQSLGLVIQQRRQAMNMTLSSLSRQMGGSPSESFLSRVESDRIVPTAKVAVRLADALQMPRELALNACGHATENQRTAALGMLREMLTEAVPVIVSIPVIERTGELDPFGQRRQRMLKVPEDVFIADLEGRANEPFVGEVIASYERKPLDGQGVVALVDGEVGAWTFHRMKSPSTTYIDNALGDKRAKGYEILGVIIRVASERDFS